MFNKKIVFTDEETASIRLRWRLMQQKPSPGIYEYVVERKFNINGKEAWLDRRLFKAEGASAARDKAMKYIWKEAAIEVEIDRIAARRKLEDDHRVKTKRQVWP